MKMYWWQGGLHIEPESDTDRNALVCLWEAERVVPAENGNAGCSTSSGSGVFLKQVENDLVTS